MFQNISIKTKITAVMLIGLLGLSAIITIIAVNKSTEALVQSQFDKLSSVETAKHGEIENYLNYLKGLLTSLAQQKGTQDAFVAFEDGFYKLQDELNLDINMVKSKLKVDFDNNYLNAVNYAVPRSEQKN